MGLRSEVDEVWLAKHEVAHTALLTAPATGTILTITGGLVRIHGIYCYCNTALDVGAAGTTFLIAVNGVAMNAPAFAVTGAIAGDIIAFPMIAVACVVGPATQMPTALALTAATGGVSTVAGPVNGIILLTVGVAALGAAEQCTFYVEYERLTPTARIA